MRPVYETQENRSQEERVMQAFSLAYNVQLVRLNSLAGADYIVYRDGTATALAEVKVRKNPRGQYPTYMISATKVYTMIAASEVMKLTPLLVVKWLDSIGWINLATAKGTIKFGGREDRGDSQDMEPCLFIPTIDFTKI